MKRWKSLVFKFKMWSYSYWFKWGIESDFFDGLDFSKCGYHCYKKGCGNCLKNSDWRNQLTIVK